MLTHHPYLNLQEVRGKGLLNAVVIEDRSKDQSYAWDICLKMADMGECLVSCGV